MTTLTEQGHAGGFIISEANGNRSRENVTIVSGEDLEAGCFLGKITSGGKYAHYNNGASDGTQTAVAVLIAKCDATGGDVAAAVIARDAEVNADELVWIDDSPSSDVTAGLADLAAVGILAR